MIISKGILKKKLFKLELFSIFLYFVIYITIIIIFKPEKNYIVEKYNVPIFNLVYTANQDSKIVENKDLLYDYFPMECFNNDLKSYMKERHNADISKNSIVYCMNNNMDEKRLLSIWFKNGIKYPVYYFDSWNNLTLGTFYLYDTSHANIYLYVKYMGTNSKKMDFMKNVDFHGKLPFVKNIIRKFTDENIQYNKLSFIRFIFQPATYIYFFILLFLLQFKKSNRKDLLLYIPLIWIYISILIGPCVIMRYIYPFVICIPFLFFINFIKEK